MLRNFRSRRRPRYGAYICALFASILLLLSVSLLHSRLTSERPSLQYDDVSTDSDPLLQDADPDDRTSGNASDDKIDELDDVVVDNSKLDSEDEESEQPKVSGYYFDHVKGVIKRAFDKRSIDQWEDYVSFDASFRSQPQDNDVPKIAFGSDDFPVDENIREKMGQVNGIEDALLLKASPLRQGWGAWFDAKSDFLRRDKMFRSNLDLLNPLYNPLLQDPDGVGVTALTRGDKLVQKLLLSDVKKFPSLVEKPKSQKRVDRRTLVNSEFSGQVYADGKRWGYYPGLQPGLSFSDFVDAFFRIGECSVRFFMVWNSPPWMFSVRQQRGFESLFFHHRDACVVVFSETIELNFFDGFVKEGFKVAVVMPNLDELLKDTPAHVFASVWFEWKRTKLYSTHYSELVRLAALYKYGGIYLDSDIVVLKSLSSLNNTVGLEDERAGNHLNGAVMAFRKHSPFVKECLMEFYSTYDDTRLRWNGADLLTRVARNFLRKENLSNKYTELKLQPFFVFFPISRNNITRYFTAPATESERAQQDVMFERILSDSFTFHFWNSLTSAMVPEPESLVARLIDHPCIHCSDVL